MYLYMCWFICIHCFCLFLKCVYIYTRTYKIHNLRVSICWTIHTHIASNRHVNILIIWWSTHISGFYQQWFLFPNQIHTVSTIWMVNQKLMISISWQFLDMCVFFDMSFVDMVSNFHPFPSNFHPFFSDQKWDVMAAMPVLWRWRPSVRLGPPRSCHHGEGPGINTLTIGEQNDPLVHDKN